MNPYNTSIKSSTSATQPDTLEPPETETETVKNLLTKLSRVRDGLQSVIRGKQGVIDFVLTAVLAEGSILLEDVPGVGKTTLAKSLASLIDLKFQRVQCTPDLLPADILGSSIYQPGRGTFEFRRGPIFCDLLIADEVNRASPRTQSALLEAMAEGQVTVDGHRYALEKPFLVIATQNPSGYEGTFPLPESQLDRFLLRLSMEYPDHESEIDMLLHQESDDPNFQLKSVMTREDLTNLQQHVRKVQVDRKIAKYVVDLVTATRFDDRLRAGCSPRGSKMLLRASQAKALLDGRTFVLPDDVQSLAAPVMSHRVSLRNASLTTADAIEIQNEIVRQVEVPL
ncbi:MoxR family ATPase [bacterium]|nr:MoxR family ATPase [bacterium]